MSAPIYLCPTCALSTYRGEAWHQVFPDGIFDPNELRIVSIAVAEGLEHEVLKLIKVNPDGFQLSA